MDYQGRQIKWIGSFTEDQNMTYTDWFLKTVGKKKRLSGSLQENPYIIFALSIAIWISVFMCSEMHTTVLKYLPQKQKNKDRSKSSSGKEF